MSLVLIDSSVWISLLRANSTSDFRDVVKNLLEDGLGAWCGIVRLELWAGVRDAGERKKLANLSSVVRELEITAEIWEEACQLAGLARTKGISAPASDILIFACSRVHKAKMLHCDKHFDQLAKL